jgi:hypothetical protein
MLKMHRLSAKRQRHDALLGIPYATSFEHHCLWTGNTEF